MFRSILSYQEALRLLTERGFWRYLWIPALVSGVLGLLFLILIIFIGPSLGNYLVSIWGIDSYPDWLQLLFQVVLIGLLILIYGFLFRYLLLVISFPFMSLVSRKVEIELYPEKVTWEKTTASGFLRELLRGVHISAALLSREFVWMSFLILLSFIPGLAFFAAPALFLIQAYYAGAANLDYTLERFYSVHGALLFIKVNKGMAIGNGIVYLLFLSVPIVGVFFAPILATIAASLVALKSIHRPYTNME